MRKHTTLSLVLMIYSFGIGRGAAQTIAIGVKGGVSLTSPLYQPDESRRYLVGPSVELEWPGHLAVEVDAIYQRLGSSSIFNVIGPDSGSSTSVVSRLRGNSWELPVLGKYYLRSRRAAWRPFLSSGYAFGTTWFHLQGQSTVFSGVPIAAQPAQQFTSNYRGSTNVGAVFAAGMRYQKKRVAVLPEFRYTYWGQTSYPQRRNAVSFILGLSF